MRFHRKSTCCVLAIMLLLSILCTSVYAASGFQGYAIYRDGVFANTNWHAGIMYRPYSTSSNPVVHHPGIGAEVERGTWNEFMNYPEEDNDFEGVYDLMTVYLQQKEIES